MIVNVIKTFKIKIIAMCFLIGILFSCSSEADFYTDFSSFTRRTSLILVSNIHDSTDCGEWGGHKEIIIIDRPYNPIEFSYYREKTNCPEDFPRYKTLPEKTTLHFKGILNKDKQAIVKEYIRKLIKFSPITNNTSNASNYYQIKLQKGAITKGIEIDDNDNSWTEYEAFRNKLINE